MQKNKNNSYSSGNAVCYYGGSGIVDYGKNTRHESRAVNIGLQSNTSVKVEVNLQKETIIFKIKGENGV